VCSDTSGFADAVALAVQSQVTVVTVGLSQDLESEGHDRPDLNLPGHQYDLVSALAQALQGTGKPLICVLIHGGTLALRNLINDCDAVLDAWYPGMQGGNAIADVLFGAYNPAGRVPVTYYVDDTQLPPAGQMDLYPVNGSMGLTYRYFTGEPALPFGFGLSYTTFEYANLRLDKTAYGPCDDITVSVDVTNSGAVAGDEVVQVYLRQTGATVPVPSIRLAAFDRIEAIAPGQTVTVQLRIEPDFHTVRANAHAPAATASPAASPRRD
jgi:beta-glucosidase